MFEEYLKTFQSMLPIGESFDVLQRNLRIANRKAAMFFIDGLTDGEKTQRVLSYLMAIPDALVTNITDSSRFIESCLPFLDVSLVEPEDKEKKEPAAQTLPSAAISELMAEDCCKKASVKLYTGLVPLIVEGLNKIIILDVRSYPARSVEEPEKEKTLRGAKDGFTETLMDNIALIRRRLRNNDLIFKYYSIGKYSKTGVVVSYMKNKAKNDLVDKLDGWLKQLAQDEKVDSLTVGDQSLLESILKTFKSYNRLNPFPRVRYTQRPDIIAAHVAEGKIAIIVDNSPTVMLIPVGIFDFLQDVDDYYFPQLTGNYLRLLRILNFLVILFLTPVYLLITQYEELTPDVLKFFVPEDEFAIPIFLQFLLLEIAVDGLKLASLNTPESLGTSLSVIGALILGDFSIDSGWFIAQTILCMAVVALASFTQPSIELSYGIKFSRILMLVGAGLFGIGGAAGGFVIAAIVLASTKTLSQDSYLYPLIPFDGKALKRLLLRTQK